MNNIFVAHETLEICKKRQYEVNGRIVTFPESDFEGVEAITPEMGKNLLGQELEFPEDGQMCRLSVINSDSYAAAHRYDKALVLNFANAHVPGGGFLHGANAQEEALCRCSTLYPSITSDQGMAMYKYNNTHINSVESDYMLISENVLVFRDEKLNLLEEPFVTSVITAPAPNRYGAGAFASPSKIKDTFERRTRIILRAAIERGYKNVVLGAWGCGAFGNKPSEVAGYFKRVIVEEKLGLFFNEICFAIYGNENGRNIMAFRKIFD
ncbi:MAG: TIGR02452 family protein [Eubacterium sp.]|nr:TIGR02452 family protein [Eubacterium sp.]